MKPFAIPIVALGPGSQPEDEQLDYLKMPADMTTYRPPVLPQADAVAGSVQALAWLREVLAAIDAWLGGATRCVIELPLLAPPDMRTLNQILGEGEASAIVRGRQGDELWQVQESVFAGIWRLTHWRDGVLVGDSIEVAAAPALFRQAAGQDAGARPPPWEGALPPEVQNAPMLLDEVLDQSRRWQPGMTPHVVNLSLLPVTLADIAFLDHHLGTGNVTILSRGYGNCRIVNTCTPNCWRLVYYNSMDKVILNTVEVVDLPEVALAAVEDLRDSRERLADVLDRLAQP